jgi:hypothetical protein
MKAGKRHERCAADGGGDTNGNRILTQPRSPVAARIPGEAISRSRKNKEPAAVARCRSFILIERSSRLAPDWLSEIDLAGVGEGTGAGTHGAADQRAFERGTHESAADGADTSTDTAARESAIARAIATAGKGEKRQGDCYDYPFHDPSPCTGLRIAGRRHRRLVSRCE